jgi:hypothetical protein
MPIPFTTTTREHPNPTQEWRQQPEHNHRHTREAISGETPRARVETSTEAKKRAPYPSKPVQEWRYSGVTTSIWTSTEAEEPHLAKLVDMSQKSVMVLL